MTLSHRTTEVERIEDIAAVEDDDGNQQSPANAAEQQATQAAVESAASEIVAEIEAALSYPNGNSHDEDGSAYPYTESPAETIRELGFQVVSAPVDVTIETIAGDVFTVPVASETVLNRWAIESIEIADPTNAAARVSWWWAGE